MDNKVLNLTYASSLTDLCEVNPSFDSGILRVAYTGANRNGSYISKETFEQCIKTIYNCPIVCNYDRESDTLGGHDMEVVRDDEDRLVLVNMTTPIGCIPESARIFWEEIEEEDGTTHEYLCVEVLLWKRQEAYKKIKKDGIVAQSMEITVKDGKEIDGLYYINNFVFTAFALIGVEPCYESASLELTTFSKQDFKTQLSEMMLELKEYFHLVNTSEEDDDMQTNNSMEGGKQVLDKNELIKKYEIDIDTLDFSIDDYTFEELEERVKAMQKDITTHNDETQDDGKDDNSTKDKFALMQNVLDEIHRAVETETIQKDWGECQRYYFVDCDMDIKEIYCWDSNDWLLYGFTYEMNGDNVVIDFSSKKRKKYVIADYDEGEQASSIAPVFAQIEQKIQDNAEWEAKYRNVSGTIESMKTEINTLRKFKADAEAAVLQGERDEVFAQFEDLAGVEAFETLKDNCAEYDIDTLEEKCFAIRGRQSVVAKFDLETKTPKIKIEKEKHINAPYGGLFEKYGFSKND